MGGGSKYLVVTFKFNRQPRRRTNTNKGVNMDIETITKLLDAGYTKEEIAQLENVGSGDDAGATGNEGAGNENEGAPGGQAGKETEVKNDEVFAMLKALTDTVNGLTTTVKALQDANAKGAHTSSPKATDEIKAAMDSFIAKL